MTLSEQVVQQAKLVCLDCKAEDIVKYGVRKGVQRYKCKPCNKVFSANGALPGKRIPPNQVGAAMSMFYEGMSYRDIQRNIKQQFSYTPSTATLYEWVRDYSAKVRQVLSGVKAKTSDTWVADETAIKTDKGKVWLWNVMDRDTRYLLATHISRTRTIADAEKLFREARKRASKNPERIITDKLAAYTDGIERVFGSATKHVQSEGIRSKELNNNLSERLQGTIKERTKVMRGLGNIETAKLFIDGFMFHYNHIKPHEGIGGRTPARAADLPLVFENWADVAHLRDDLLKPNPIVKDKPIKTTPVLKSKSVIRKRNLFRGSLFKRPRGGL